MPTVREAAAMALDATMAVTGEATLTELEANPDATVKAAGLDVARLARALAAEWPNEEEPDYFAQKARDIAREYAALAVPSDAPEVKDGKGWPDHDPVYYAGANQPTCCVWHANIDAREKAAFDRGWKAAIASQQRPGKGADVNEVAAPRSDTCACCGGPVEYVDGIMQAAMPRPSEALRAVVERAEAHVERMARERLIEHARAVLAAAGDAPEKER